MPCITRYLVSPPLPRILRSSYGPIQYLSNRKQAAGYCAAAIQQQALVMALIIKFSVCSTLLQQFLTLLCYTAVGPTNVEILNGREPLSAGKRYEVKCQSIGARPPPTVTWWLGGKQVCLQYFMTYTNLPQSYYITGCDKYVTYSSNNRISILID